MPDFTQRPDDKFIDDAQSYLSDLWRGAHEDWFTLDSFFQRTFNVWQKSSDASKIVRPDYRPSKPANIIKHAVDNMMTFNPKVHRNPVGRSDTKEEEADLAEVGLSAILRDSAVRATQHPWRTAATHLVHYSYAVIEGPLPRFSGSKEHTPDSNPIDIRAPNPGSILMDPMDKEPPFAIRRGKMPAVKILELSQQKVRQRRRNAEVMDFEAYKDTPFMMVDFHEYWTEQWHAFRVPSQGSESSPSSAQLLYVEKNPMGFLPYTHAFGGFGIEPSDLDAIDPRFLARGILWDALDSIRLQAQSRNAKHQALIDAVFAPLLTAEDPEELKRRLAEGADILQVDDPNSTKPMQTQQIARWIFEIDREYTEDIEEATVNRNQAGLREQGVVTVGQQQLLDTRARQRFNLPLMELENMAAITGSRILNLVDNMDKLGGSIGAYGKNIKKSWLHGNYNCQVSFEPSDPALSLQQRQQGLSEVAAGVKDFETYWEQDEGVTNIAERWSRLARQQVRTSPEIWAMFMQEAAEEEGVGDEFQASQEAAAEAGQGEMGMPPMANGSAPEPLREPLSGTTVKPAPLRGPIPGGV
jgi:hypothetical protein